MRRRTPPGERPKLTLIDGGLSAEEVERLEARRLHPAGTLRDEPGDEPGPVAG